MSIPTAADTLVEARAARSCGDVDACVRLAVLTMDKAKDERAPDVAFLAACAPGRLYASRAEPHEATGWYRTALEVALEYGLTRRLPECYHDLHVVSRDDGETAQARRYFSTATELYLDVSAGHPRLVALYADASEAAFMRQPSPETAADALLCWRSFSAALAAPADRFLGGCSIMVAAAWLGLRGRYWDGVALMEDAYPRLPDHLGVSAALLHAASGSLKARDYPRGLALAQEALSIARVRGEGIVEAKARETIKAALAERESAGLLA